MTLPRRSFLRSGAMTALVAGVALDKLPVVFAQQLEKSNPSQDFIVSVEAKQESIFYFNRETFQPYVGGVFTLRAGANSVEATLVTVRNFTQRLKPGKGMPRSRRSESFALIFSAPEKLTELTTIYDVEHGALGKFALFLSRRDNPDGTYFYEAVFNHAR